jgi:hypothetical protein
MFVYSRELDLLVSANFITRNNVEEENSPPYLKFIVTNSKEAMTNYEDTTPMAIPQSTMGSNKLNDPPMALG